MGKYFQKFWQRPENLFNGPFGQAFNPWYHLGSITFFLFWVILVSGIYLYIFYRTGVHEAYQTVEDLTHEQWYAGGVMRSMHRYASDALVLTMLLHLLRNFVSGRFHSYRWFSWVTGVLLIWLVVACGINGYWLVWDKLAQFIALATAEWFDWLPLFSQPLARNFLIEGNVSDRFFVPLSFTHVTLPLVLLLVMWIHTKRMNHAKTNPPRRLVVGTTLALLVLSLVKPAVSHAPADLTMAPGELFLDWFYLALYPLVYVWPPGAVWALVAGGTLFLTAVPWIFRPRTSPPPVAEVHLDNCNGCERCFKDCPYSAIVMQPRSDGRPYPLEPVVNPDLCASCGICVGACPSSMPFRSGDLVSGMELPHHQLATLRAQVDRTLSALQGDTKVMVFGCDCAYDIRNLESKDVGVLSFPCIGMLPPAFVDYALRDGRADGVLVTGCHEGDCQYRLGIRWTEQRIAREREPHLRKRVPLERIESCWAGVHDAASAGAALARLRQRISEMPHETFPEEGSDKQ